MINVEGTTVGIPPPHTTISTPGRGVPAVSSAMII